MVFQAMGVLLLLLAFVNAESGHCISFVPVKIRGALNLELAGVLWAQHLASLSNWYLLIYIFEAIKMFSSVTYYSFLVGVVLVTIRIDGNGFKFDVNIF
jgi:hypothetical protein